MMKKHSLKDAIPTPYAITFARDCGFKSLLCPRRLFGKVEVLMTQRTPCQSHNSLDYYLHTPNMFKYDGLHLERHLLMGQNISILIYKNI
jgi:hypothetical protein